MTKNYNISQAAHQRLENIMMRNCDRVIRIDYGLKILPDTVLHIANSNEFRWLLQPELKAIKNGLKYCSKDIQNYRGYRGYVNEQGQSQGVGIMTTMFFSEKSEEIGEWHQDSLHGIAKDESSDRYSYWGQIKNGMKEGYGTLKWADGRVYYGQFKNGSRNGYGIQVFADGRVYHGEFKDNSQNGFGHMKYSNNDEYDGEWLNNFKNGQGVYKEASSGKV